MVKKKSAKKKPATKHKMLRKVRPEHTFIVVDGRRITTLPQLALEMDNMADEIFSHHVNSARNDFATWIRDVIGEIELADRLMGVNTRKDTQLHILRHIVKSMKS